MGEESATQDSGGREPALSTHDLFGRLYAELRRLAALRMAGERAGHTLQPTALVNEVWLRLSTLRQQTWRDESHFIGAASETMRRILVDRARRRQSAKNGGQLRRTRLELDDLPGSQATVVDLLDVDHHLTRFAQTHPDKARIIELRFFAGLSLPEIAVLTGQSERTVQRHWSYARTWLYDAIERERELEREREGMDLR